MSETEEKCRRIADIHRRLGRLSAIERRYRKELVDKIRQLGASLFGRPGDEILFRYANDLSRGKIVRFEEGLLGAPICVIEVHGDFITYEVYIGDADMVVRQ